MNQRKSVIIKLHGGLGNQLFQYALAQSIKLSNQSLQIEYDTSFYLIQSHKYPRQLSINCYLSNAIPLNTLQRKSKKNMWVKLYSFSKKSLKKYKTSAVSKIIYALFLKYANFIEEDFASGYQLVLSNRLTKLEKENQTILLTGYWSDYRYFSSVLPTLNKQIVLQKPSNKFYDLKSAVLTDDIMIHVRRGDYLTIGQKQEGLFIGLEYYRKSLAILKDRKILNERSQIWIFSDDVQWCKDSFRHHFPDLKYRWDANQLTDEESFELMREFKYRIIANSTFSLWSIYLTKCQQHLAIVPQNWISQLNSLGYMLFDEEANTKILTV